MWQARVMAKRCMRSRTAAGEHSFAALRFFGLIRGCCMRTMRADSWRGRARSMLRSIACGAGAVAALLAVIPARAESPPQRLPSAVLQYPLIVVEGGGLTRDTRVELVNLTNRDLEAQCFYVQSGFCSETDFFVRLTANQPQSWLASRGASNSLTGSAVPPFSGTGELKCVVLPSRPEVDAHNAIQGRAIVFGADGQTISYGATGFRRLTDGDYTSLIELDGETYTQCPGELHFAFIAADDDPSSAPESEMVLVPCSEDLENLRPATTSVLFQIVNEFEETLSASLTFTCYDRRPLRRISNVFTAAFLGSPTGHVTVRGVQEPLLGLIVDQFVDGALSTSANEPFLRDGRSAVLRFP